MNFRKSTRYALYAALEMTRADADEPVVAARVAEEWGVPASVLAKVFQRLVRRGIAVGTRGQRGGYRLARPAARITMLDVIEAFESLRGPAVPPGDPPRDVAASAEARLRNVLGEVDELVRCTFASISLETLAGRSPAAAQKTDGRGRREGV